MTIPPNPFKIQYKPNPPRALGALPDLHGRPITMQDATVRDTDILENRVRAYLSDHYGSLMQDPLAATDTDLRLAVQDGVRSLNIGPQDGSLMIERLMADLVGAGELQQYLDQKNITEIMVIGEKVFVEINGKIEPAQFFANPQAAIAQAQKMTRHVKLDYLSTRPLMNFVWPRDGSRINITHHAVSPNGVVITIRKRNQERILDLADLIDANMMTPAVALFLIRAVNGKLNLIIAGPTGSGKTVVLRALATAGINPRERLLVLEDTEELRLTLPHVVNLIGLPMALTDRERDSGLISLLDAFRNGLRQRPDRIIMGELRGPESFDYVEAGLTEPGGMLTSIHIKKPEYLIDRLYWIAHKNGLSVPENLIASSVWRSTDLIIQVERDGSGHRHITHVVETLANGQLRSLFHWDVGQQTLVADNALTDERQQWIDAHQSPDFVPAL